MVRVTGLEAAVARIRGVGGAEMVKALDQVLYVVADTIKADAQHSITEGSISGAGHVASAPGQPPNADTHALDRQIEAELVGPLHAVVAANDPKAKFLELGTSRMAARPFMQPAAQRNRTLLVTMVRDAVSRVTSRRGR